MNIKVVGIVTKPRQPEVAAVARRLADWLRARGVDPLMETDAAELTGQPGLGVAGEILARKSDLVVVVGGDGTLLAAARLLEGRDVPVLGINHGGLGFLTAVPLEGIYRDLERILDGEYSSDSRMMIDASIVRDNQAIATHQALNDVVINKGTPARIIEVEARVDDQYVSTFRADGLIVSTPTGSTAYNMSAGGPIVHPDLDAILVTPICSHTLTNRPIVLPANVHVVVTLRSPDEQGVFATVDGQLGVPMQPGDALSVSMSEGRVRLVAPVGKDYFGVLRGKLKWG